RTRPRAFRGRGGGELGRPPAVVAARRGAAVGSERRTRAGGDPAVGAAASGVMNVIRPPEIPDLSQHEVLASIEELIDDVASGANQEWENPRLERYLEAMWAWLDDRSQSAWDSMDQRMIGHVLSPPGDFRSLADYFAAVKRRVQAPADGWASHLAFPS